MAPRKKPIAALVPTRVPESGQDDTGLETLLDSVDDWQRVWDLKWSGFSFRRIAVELGISKTEAHRMYHRYRQYRGVSPKIEDEREHQLAGLAEMEAKLIREATKGEVAWTATAVALRGIYADRREILGFDSAAPAGELPGAGERPQSVERALSVVRDLRGDSSTTG